MTALALVALVVLVFLNGIFVAAEFALVRSRRSRFESPRGGGQRRRRRVVEQLDGIDRYLSTCQIGITMASIGIGFLGEPAIATPDRARLRRERLARVATAISFAIAFTIATSLHITIGEQVPKIVAINRAERDGAAARRGRSTGFTVVTTPFSPGDSTASPTR